VKYTQDNPPPETVFVHMQNVRSGMWILNPEYNEWATVENIELLDNTYTVRLSNGVRLRTPNYGGFYCHEWKLLRGTHPNA